MRRLVRWVLRGVGLLVALLVLYVVASVVFAAVRERRDPEQAAPNTGRIVSVDGVRVFAQLHPGRAGRTPVLLVHGTAAWSGTWFELIPALQRAGYPVLAVDLPPFGYSDKRTTIDFSRTAQAARLRGVLDAFGVQRALVVGHSFGGGPALEFALRWPTRVERLVLVDAALGLTAPPPDASSLACRVLAMPRVRHVVLASTAANPLWSGTLLRGFVARKEAVTSQRLAAYREPGSLAGASNALAAWAHHFACVRETGFSMDPDRIRAIRVPMSLAWGADDTITPPAQAAHLRSLVPGTPLAMLDGVGHIPHIEAPDAFARVLLDTLAAPAPLAASDDPQ
jgi:pimeloyl-ACP methyl ester carboxylesterase